MRERENNTVTESQVRYRPSKIGLTLRKSRVRSVQGNNLGDYMVVDVDTNCVVIGGRFDATLNDVIQHFELAERS